MVSDLLLSATAVAGFFPSASTDQQQQQQQLLESQHLSIREKGGRVYVEGLSRSKISSSSDLMSILTRGDTNRSTAETNMNATSSRSHAALIVSILMPETPLAATATKGALSTSLSSSSYSSSAAVATATATAAKLSWRESTLVLVDLAGSERATASSGKQYMRLEEAKAINLSLSALGNCMSALSEGRKHVPYRDSRLTRLLQGSLGGGARTSVIVTVAPIGDESGEILNALRFAARAAKVKVVAKVQRLND